MRQELMKGSITSASHRETRQAWLLLGVLLLAYISSIIDRVVISFVVQPMKLAFGVSDSAVSYLGGIAFTLFYAVLGLPIALFADRLHAGKFTRHHLIASGIAVWSIATMLCGLTTTYTEMFSARIGVAIGEAVLGPVAYALLAGAFSHERRALALSIYGMGIPIGQGIAYWVAGIAVHYASSMPTISLSQIVGLDIAVWVIPGWQFIFFIVGFPGLVIALMLACIPYRRVEHQPIVYHDSPSKKYLSLSAFLRQHHRGVLWHCVGFGAFALYYQGAGFWFVEHFVRSYGWRKADIGAVYGLCSALFGTIGLLAGGLYSKQQGATISELIRRKYHVLQVCAVSLVLVGTAMPLMPTGLTSALMLGCVCCVCVAPYGIASAVIQDIAPLHLRAQIGGVYLLILNIIGSVLGPIMVSWVTEHGFGVSTALRYSISIIGFSAGVVSFWMMRKACKILVQDHTANRNNAEA